MNKEQKKQLVTIVIQQSVHSEETVNTAIKAGLLRNLYKYQCCVHTSSNFKDFTLQSHDSHSIKQAETFIHHAPE